MTLTWRCTLAARGPHGETLTRCDCVEYPRVYRMVQTDADGVERDLYYVTGIAAQHYSSFEAARAASEANPCS